ncbi:MAG: hypothetical protein JSS68_15110 [Actinobacteria bacterium]|nr:hypothetical protein [Actinomycetota bacterium]
MATQFVTKGQRERNRPMRRMNRAQLTNALAAHDRIQAISDEIRRRHGLAPVPENVIVREARARLAAFKAPRVLSPSEALAELVKRRQKLDREREAFDADLLALIRSGEVPKAMIARAMGITRQRVYQLAA